MSFSSATVVDPAGAKGLFTGGGFHLLGLEVLAAVVTAAYAFGASWLFAQVTQRLIGLRVEPEPKSRAWT